MRKALAAVTSLLAAAAGTLVAVTPAQASGSLAEHAAAHGKYFGDAVDNNEITDTAYRPHIAAEFSQLTPGNAMKWDSTEPNPGQFTYSRGDEIVALAQQNGQTVRGHTLVWHNQTPGWVQNLDATALRAALQNHIQNVVTHYRGDLYAWDVVNEPLNEDGTFRNSFWYQKLGPSYIADAFRAARAADPDVKLYINDYNTDGLGAKSDGMYRLVQDLLTQGVPIDGVGFQAHLAIQYGFPNQMRQNLQRFAALGLDVAVTELDVRMQLPADSTKLATQATYYRNVTNACLAVARCVGITTWGYTDKYSWVPSTFPGEGAALLVDENFQRKPAYTAVHDALAGGATPDTTPPTTPGTPGTSGITATGAALSWTASTDTGGSGLAGYTVYRADGSVLAQPATNAAALTGLTPSTRYEVYVRARDGAGNLSAPSASVTFTTTEGQAGTCVVGYNATNWGGGGGFTATVTISNTGTTTVDGWTLAFTFPSGQRITPPGWSATWSQDGTTVTAANLSWNRTIAAHGSTGIGFNGTYSGTNTPPTAFTLNGTQCAVA
ncbi:endo-1,4-beta-xylanase [Actinophytocola algeriensis]|uniref:Beta-xylanase n=1 Tax=Actinophytocola algeriensis TaxID=1768010 RepID=A0A7W7QBH9_9PSEU|nr:endo-1,4-beta-xylanase [Actinophytocola algeriensis]MBB4910106.1 endo-1,4-beta-xylanase [Actinophytocola algeriensis]MBE1480906.1 endo-1,4-beta-xylanase [Actinophytocola algeriensis]